MEIYSTRLAPHVTNIILYSTVNDYICIIMYSVSDSSLHILPIWFLANKQGSEGGLSVCYILLISWITLWNWNWTSASCMQPWVSSRFLDFGFWLCGELCECNMSINSSKDTWWSWELSGAPCKIPYESKIQISSNILMLQGCLCNAHYWDTPINPIAPLWLWQYKRLIEGHGFFTALLLCPLSHKERQRLAISVSIHGGKVEAGTSLPHKVAAW